MLLPEKVNKMNFILISLVISTLLFQFNQAIKIITSSENLLIKANLTHKESNNTWILTQMVYFMPWIHGVISIHKGDIALKVISNDIINTIVFFDNRAMNIESMLNFTWDGVQLPVPTIRLINKALLLGPTACYHYLYVHDLEKKSERSLKIVHDHDGQKLFWVYEFKVNIGDRVALRKLDSITIYNTTNNPFITMQIVKFVSLDSLVIAAEQQFFVGFNETLTDHIHQSTVNIQFNSTKDTVIPISWKKYARQEIDYEQVDDLGSDLSSTATTNNHVTDRCASNQNESFNFVSLNFQEFFWTNWTFRYPKEILFPIKYQHRDQIIMDKMEFDKKIGNFSYDLMITTLRVARLPRNISSDLVLQNLQVERKLYNKENKFSLEYQLIKTQKTLFSGYTKLNYKPEHQVDSPNNEKPFKDVKMDVLTVQLIHSKKLSTIETFTLLEKLDELGENLKELICFKLGISKLRIKTVRFQLYSTHLLASVVIIERLNIVDLLKHRKLDLSEFVNFLSSDIETCNFSKIISCNDISHGCIGLTLDQPLHEQNKNRSNAVVYNNLDKLLYKLVQEPSLSKLKMSYKLLNQATLHSVKLSFNLHVIDSSQKDSHSSIDTDSFNEKVGIKNYFGQYVFRILVVVAICAVIGFAVILGKLYRRNVQISSFSSISMTILNDS